MDTFFLSNTNLFRGTTPEEVASMLGCLMAEEKYYRKDEVIYRTGDIVHKIGMVITGSVSIENDDIWGNKSILDKIGPGQVFAETYACAPGEPLMVSAVAAETTGILFLDVAKTLQPCSSACGHHGKLIRNLLTISAQKNLVLSRRIFHTSAKSIRGRLLSYLSFQATREGQREFDIPFNRQQLADYLSVDRSALSNELGKMQREGLITVHRNHFCIKSDIK
ncbi:transcriptional regulator FixK [Anaerotignum neopropionicum]|uniref:Transcriptional regulator FixK n=1 Tax=Anaerotignum neopropionicum TaxID=36847 RepID=A0A136WET1_9FIRM|nr:Crp/Fnr family transcriptional regulator [Anaerotignum neopropionicum]KXL52967.1 transcriptional regulator FixK [Anaerotignum neopropionicum]